MRKLRPSSTFANSRDIQKLVDDSDVLGYVVLGGGRMTGATVIQLLRADMHVNTRTRRGKAERHIFSSFEHGERLNGNLLEDDEGAILAQVAALAIGALERRARSRKAQEEYRRVRRRRSNSRARKRPGSRDR